MLATGTGDYLASCICSGRLGLRRLLQEKNNNQAERPSIRLQFFCIAVVWPVLMGMTGLTTYIAVVYSVPINVATNFSYMSAIIVTCVNIAGAKLVTKTTEIEGWSGRTQIKVESHLQRDSAQDSVRTCPSFYQLVFDQRTTL